MTDAEFARWQAIHRDLVRKEAPVRHRRDPAWTCRVELPVGTPTRGIYYVQGTVTKLIKIGLASNVQKRIDGIQGSSPDRIAVLAVTACDSDLATAELKVHRLFAFCRSHGEWFHPHADLLEHIEILSGGAKVHRKGMADRQVYFTRPDPAQFRVVV